MLARKSKVKWFNDGDCNSFQKVMKERRIHNHVQKVMKERLALENPFQEEEIKDTIGGCGNSVVRVRMDTPSCLLKRVGFF